MSEQKRKAKLRSKFIKLWQEVTNVRSEDIRLLPSLSQNDLVKMACLIAERREPFRDDLAQMITYYENDSRSFIAHISD